MLKKFIQFLFLFLLIVAVPVKLAAQDGSVVSTENPLAVLHDEVSRILAEAMIPFSEDQEHSIVLMMEERRKASEDLFGDLNNFQAGPTRGQENDRLQSAIQWLRGEFLTRLQNFLTPQQLTAWKQFESTQTPEPAEARAIRGDRPQPPQRQQTQYVRLNNNSFTSENNGYNANSGNQGTEVIQRGGAGAWHGNMQFFFQNEKLNAGRRFANNKPPYQERQTSFDFSGPMLPGRLTTGVNASQNESQNVDTINATLGDGSIFALGIVKPSINRNVSTNGVYQLSQSNSLRYNLQARTQKSENQNVGGFTLPERGATQKNHNTNLELRQFSAISSRTLFESSFSLQRNHNQRTPVSEAIQINVLDAFNGGGAQNNLDNQQDNYVFSTLFTRLGEKLTVKAGVEGSHRRNDSYSKNNFLGTFTFSSLAAYNDNRPLTFRVTRGIPKLKFKQTETAFFIQNDLKLTPRLTFMYGMRYEIQTNIRDHNNFDPRLALAYGLGKATVIRAGFGVFHQRIQNNVIENQVRQNGTTQYEIVIDNPAYPDAFQGGTIRNSLPSIRVLDRDLADPYVMAAMASYERTFLTNLQVNVLYDYTADVHRVRTRNINSRLDITSPTPKSCRKEQIVDVDCVRPDPGKGNILNTESTGREEGHNLRVTYRQRLQRFQLSATYQFQLAWSDSLPNNNNNFNGGGNNGGGGGNNGGGGGNNGGGGGNNNFNGGGNNNFNQTQFGFTSDGLGSDQYNLRSDWAQNAFPLHQLSGSVNARLPLGIFLTQTVSGNTGRLYTITTGTDDNKDSGINDRPAGVKRNSAPGPKQLTFNYAITKAFFLGKGGQPAGGAANGRGSGGRGGAAAGTNVQVYINVNNAFNRPNYNAPSGVLTSPNFGKSTSAGNPREVELGLRFQF